jgi:hypothetical protein
MNSTKRPYRITNLATGRTVTATTERNAQITVARQIASDVEGQVVRIAGPEGTTYARNNGLTITYTAA